MDISYNPTIFVISGPSGVGKSSICERVVEDVINLDFSISTTTREPREGEVDGLDYYFVNHDEFECLIKNNSLIEYAVVHNNYYGTRRDEVDRRLENGDDVLLDIDIQGAEQIYESTNNSVSIFILPPSLEELRRRISGREGEITVDYEDRLKVALLELKHIDNYDYVVINNVLEVAVNSVISIIYAERLKKSRLKIDINER